MNRATRRIVGMACGSWSCGLCAPVKRSQVIRRLRLGLETDDALSNGRRPRFLTLSTDPGETFEIAAARLGAHFQRLRRLVEERTGQSMEYLGVVERGTRGARRVHLHVVYRGPWLPQSVWSELAEQAGLGRVVDIRAVRSAALAAYASKALGSYLTKAAGAVWPRHFRRVRVSRGWAPAWVTYRPSGSGEWLRLGMAPGFEPIEWVKELVRAREQMEMVT